MNPYTIASQVLHDKAAQYLESRRPDLLEIISTAWSFVAARAGDQLVPDQALQARIDAVASASPSALSTDELLRLAVEILDLGRETQWRWANQGRP